MGKGVGAEREGFILYLSSCKDPDHHFDYHKQKETPVIISQRASQSG